jgi:hypothetical protein
MFPYESQKAMIVRGSVEKVAAADWLVRQLCPAEGTAPTADSPAYPSPVGNPREPDAVIRVFRMDPETTPSDLTAMTTAIRTVADLARLFPYERGRALIASGTQAQIATAEWLVHQVGKPGTREPQETTLSTMPHDTDTAVRLFFTNSPTQLSTLIRTRTGITRIFPLVGASAVVLRGRPDLMPAVETLVAQHAASIR